MQARRTEAGTFRSAPSGIRILAADGWASSSSNPACCFCAVWPRRAEEGGGGHVRTRWFGHAHLPMCGRCAPVYLCNCLYVANIGPAHQSSLMSLLSERAKADSGRIDS
jgi:hypothetical protein